MRYIYSSGRIQMNKIGKSLYYSKREAAVQAEQATKRYENTWGWVGDPHIPMRRTWKYLLLENVGERQMNIFDFPEVLP